MALERFKTEGELCRCCHSEGRFVDFSDVYEINGEEKTYADVFLDTFNVQILPIRDKLNNTRYKICELCIIKLGEAALFKRQVLASEKLYYDMLCKDRKNDAVGDIIIEIERLDDSINENTKGIDEGNVALSKNIKEEENFDEIEYLEDEPTTSAYDKNEIDKDSVDYEVSKGRHNRKGNNNKPRKRSSIENRYKKYFKYTEEDLRNAMKAVKDNRMSRLEASEYYHVPRKTISFHLNAEIENPENQVQRDLMFSFIQEIKTILTFTNATPFKNHRNNYSCAYCTEFKSIDFADIRSHTRSAHTDDRTKKVDIMMRPHSTNEIIRFDIENLLCVVCCVLIEDWNTMFRHLEGHDIRLEQSLKRVVPYMLSADFKCALCYEEFLNYTLLDCHMNKHYSNYICGECGQTYLTKIRLNSHMESHRNAKPIKEEWDMEPVEKPTKFKCKFCSARFVGEGEKRQHMMKYHKETLAVLTCEKCGKKFNFLKFYRNHIEKVHGSKYLCIICDKLFCRKSSLTRHERKQHGLTSDMSKYGDDCV